MTTNGAGFTLAIAGMLVLCGCNSQQGKPAVKDKAAAEKKHEDHDHPSEGPHQGQLIELGQEEYHAELVHDDANHTLTIYLLDSKAKDSVPIDAKQLVLNLVVSGKPQQYSLPAKPLSTDPAGKSSCFTTNDEAACEALDNEKTAGRLNVTIQGKSFTGKIEHHDHEEHKK